MQTTLMDYRDQLFLVINLLGNDHSTDIGMGIGLWGDVHLSAGVYCKVGGRAGIAKKTLEKMGYKIELTNDAKEFIDVCY